MEGVGQQVIENPVEYFDSNDRVLALMDMRRNRLALASDSQQHADEIKARLCNKIQELVRSVPGLRARIVAISEIDPELSAYIMALESINAGIWCAKCKQTKKLVLGTTLSDAPETVQAAPPTESISLEHTKLQAHLYSAKEEMRLLMQEQTSMKTRFDLLTIKLESYQKRLDELTNSKLGNPNNQQSAQPVHTTQQSNQPTQKATSRFADMKKEDLPPAPDLDINFTAEGGTTADSLLE